MEVNLLLTQDQERRVCDRDNERHADVEHEAEGGDNGQAGGEDAQHSHPHLVPDVVQSVINSYKSLS